MERRQGTSLSTRFSWLLGSMRFLGFLWIFHEISWLHPLLKTLPQKPGLMGRKGWHQLTSAGFPVGAQIVSFLSAGNPLNLMVPYLPTTQPRGGCQATQKQPVAQPLTQYTWLDLRMFHFSGTCSKLGMFSAILLSWLSFAIAGLKQKTL